MNCKALAQSSETLWQEPWQEPKARTQSWRAGREPAELHLRPGQDSGCRQGEESGSGGQVLGAGVDLRARS